MKGKIRLGLAAVLLASASAASSAAERVLFVLGAADASGKPVRLQVLEKAGIQVPKAPVAQARWHVLPGDAVRAKEAPPGRMVELYAGTATAPESVARVLVRYFASGNAWVPHYRITDEPAVVRRDDRWAPVMIGQGMPGLIVQHGGTLPNADGFFPRIEFSLTTGLLAVSAWQVR